MSMSAPKDGKRVTARLKDETYAGLTVLKLQLKRPLEQLIEEACAAYVQSHFPDEKDPS